ncbi:reverse transcriptase domain-containing protein [Tanacetum coccineum]
MVPATTSLVGFSGEIKWPLGQITLLVKVGDDETINSRDGDFMWVLSKVSGEIVTIFKTLKKCTKKSNFLWTKEAEAAFKQMKEHIAKLPMLTAPEEKEELIVYLAASKEAVSAVLMTEKGARQMPIYFKDQRGCRTGQLRKEDKPSPAPVDPCSLMDPLA